MMTMLNATPIDYLTWGNHETDLKHHEVMACESMYNGIFINTNMRDHESCFRPGSRQRDSVVLDLVDRESGWTHARRVGLVGLLLNDKGIYRPGAFGGATIEDPWEVLRQYNASLREEAGCDLVIPLCHFYQAQDRRTAREFPGQFPVILSGHDHHPVDEIVEGTSTRLLKPGSNAEFAVVVDITWENSNKDCNPSVNAETVHVNDWAPDEEAYAIMKAAMQVLTAMRQTTLMIPGKAFRPLTSVGIRRTSVTMGTLLCTEIRKAINSSEGLECDACLIKGGAFRGEARYLDTASFTLATLEEELPRNQPVAILPVPGRVLAAGMAWNRRAPGAAWLQTDDMLKEGPGGVLLEVGGATFDPDTVYKVATFPGLWCTPGCPISTYLRRHCRGLLDVDDDMPVQALLMGYWASSAWARIRSMLDVDGDGVITAEELALLDTNKDGRLCEEELREALCRLGFDSCCGENKFLSQVLSAGGSEGGGLTLEDINSEQPAKPLKR